MMPRSQHEHEKEDNIFLSAALAEMLKLPRSTKWGGSWNELSLHVDLLKMYKCAEKLEVPSLVDISEPTRSHYGGKNVPLARIVVKQPLLPELLAELPNICSNCPDSNRSPILVEALVVAHLCPGSKSQLSAASSRHLTPPTQPGQFPSAHAPASQAELSGVSADPNMWEDMAVNAILSLYPACLSPGHRQGDGDPLDSGARWLSLTNMIDREWDEILDMLISTEGILVLP